MQQQPYVMPAVRSFNAGPMLSVVWQDGRHQQYSWFWLKDHGEDTESLHPHTFQRQVDTFSIPQNLQPESVVLSDKQQFRIRWFDQTETWINVQTLALVSGLLPVTSHLLPADRRLWSAENKPMSLPTVEYQELLDNEAAVKKWLNLIHTWGFAVVTGCQADEAGTIKLAEHIAKAQETIFGRYWFLSAEVNEHADSAYETHFLAPHTDGTYYDNAGGLQLFNCVEFDGSGGESLLVDGFALAAALKNELPEHYELLTEVLVPGRYIEPKAHLYAERPVFRLGRDGGLQQVSFNNYDRAPFLLEGDKMRRFYEAYQAFNQLVMDQTHWLRIPLRPGNALVFDNWRCLHGRMGYQGKRAFYGCYIDHADYENRLRVLNAM